jgi:hypothetical protein
VDPRAGLDYMKKIKFLTLQGLEPRPLGRPTCSQSLYPLCYPGSYYSAKSIWNCNSILSSASSHEKSYWAKIKYSCH